jgi:hypothetical protein
VTTQDSSGDGRQYVPAATLKSSTRHPSPSRAVGPVARERGDRVLSRARAVESHVGAWVALGTVTGPRVEQEDGARGDFGAVLRVWFVQRPSGTNTHRSPSRRGWGFFVFR